MSASHHHQVMMESSLALGRLELTSAVGVNMTPCISPGASTKEMSGPRQIGTQGPAHLNGCVPLSHQVAGHKYGVDKVGILQHPDGTVLKQLQPPPRGPREMQFYSMVYAEDCCDPCLLELQNHLPKYYGTLSSPDAPNDLYMKLEDVTRRFVKPCIMDVKLGQRSYDPYASQEKREQQIRKYPLMEEIGFLVLGMRVYKLCNDTVDTFDQHYGRGLLKDTIKDGLAKFFHNGVCLRKDAVMASICRVQNILRWFESQRQLVFYASSLLFVYEGLPSSSVSSAFPLTGPAATGKDWNEVDERRREVGEKNEKMAEYNNNNIENDRTLESIYSNRRKASLHLCAKTQLQGGGGDDATLGTTVDKSPPRDNSSWLSQQAPNGNRNKSQLEEETREQENSVGRDEDIARGDEATALSEGNAQVEVKMIDFAHVFPSDGHDHGYIYGLKHLLTVLKQILSDEA
ncbi:inositol polyphosphate multikinase [Corythoichthys intestinalis]|uniref:inositol polyphosphate multikinase n=1 Tax=Corythoichthys intestinalis TaxID=161448 RepID=UPI0025A59D1F|nr:inositol polyphosphate multikinase [Corythoichthys intestinalis]XP_061807159.1 inositol polyphosphate multikinase [Nerophis lumbriciformis]